MEEDAVSKEMYKSDGHSLTQALVPLFVWPMISRPKAMRACVWVCSTARPGIEHLLIIYAPLS